MNEIAVLFNYKGRSVIMRMMGSSKFQVGIRSPKGLDFWLEDGVYNSLKVARTSGIDFARSWIDKLLLASRKNNYG